MKAIYHTGNSKVIITEMYTRGDGCGSACTAFCLKRKYRQSF